MTQQVQEPVKSGKRIWIHVLWITLTVITLLIAALCIAGFKLFDSEPMKLDQEGTSPLLAFTVMQKGQQNLKAMKRATPMSIFKVQYTEDEFNFMIRTMILANKFQKKQGISPETTSIVVKNGVYRIKHIMKTEGNPFGSFLNLTLELKLEVQNGKEEFQVISAKAGSFNIPKKKAEQEISSLLQTHYTGTAQEDLVKKSILKFQADGKDVILEYKPYELIHCIDQIYFGGNGTFLRNIGHGSAK